MTKCKRIKALRDNAEYIHMRLHKLPSTGHCNFIKDSKVKYLKELAAIENTLFLERGY